MIRYPVYPRSPFSQLARWTAKAAGHPLGFLLAVMVIVAWAATGPLFGFSDTWQLVINTGTTIVTFLMVFLIQNTQNHDGAVVQLKLDELIRAERNAHNALLDLDELTDQELERLRAHYLELARQAREQLRQRGRDTGSPELGLDWATGDGGDRPTS
ncbi:MAG TPA: low affinity iron permease family protein [Dehalococcoidia bacterium]|nr:low affinity iron permease family protein [Dehalococcoidia bacterium]